MSLVDLSTTKNFIKIEDNEDRHDTILQLLIEAISDLFDSFTERTLEKTTYTDKYLDGSGQKILDFPNWPIVTLTSLAYDDVVLTEGLEDDFILYADEGYIYKNFGVWAALPKIIKTTFEAGFVTSGTVTLPGDLKLAALKQIAFEFKQASASQWGEISRSFEGGSITVTEENLLPSVKEVLNRYVKDLVS